MKVTARIGTVLNSTTLLLILLLAPAALSAQEREVPKDSLRVSIPGCAKGSAFVVTASPEPDRSSTEIATGRRFRLTGKKAILDEIKKREGTMVEVTGIIRKSDLAGPGGISLGGGRVRIGGGPPVDTGGGAARAPVSGNAILDIEGWRPLAESCPR
jgi:hypothetical protein